MATRNKGAVDQKTPQLNLSNTLVEKIRRQDGFTFQPVAKGKLVCNQLPELGRIGKKRAETLRRQLWPKRHLVVQEHRDNYQVPMTQLSAPVKPRVTAKIYFNDYIMCPYCSHGDYFPGAYNAMNFSLVCRNCRQTSEAYPI